MLQTCNEEYWRGMENLKPPDAPCGQVFDDAECLTYCPHDLLTKTTIADLKAIAAEHGIDLPKGL